MGILIMGIQDRDYMKRPSGDGAGHGASADTRLEQFFSDFLRRHRRLVKVLGVAFAVLIIASILVAIGSNKGR